MRNFKSFVGGLGFGLLVFVAPQLALRAATAVERAVEKPGTYAISCAAVHPGNYPNRTDVFCTIMDTRTGEITNRDLYSKEATR